MAIETEVREYAQKLFYLLPEKFRRSYFGYKISLGIDKQQDPDAMRELIKDLQEAIKYPPSPPTSVKNFINRK